MMGTFEEDAADEILVQSDGTMGVNELRQGLDVPGDY